MNEKVRRTLQSLAALVLALTAFTALTTGLLPSAQAQLGPTVYVVIAIDTENGDISWYPGQPRDTDPYPLFDTHNFRKFQNLNHPKIW